MPYGGYGLHREASTATGGPGRFRPHRGERPVCGSGPFLPARVIPRVCLPSHSAMASPWLPAASPNRNRPARACRSIPTFSHHRANWSNVGSLGLGRARRGPLDSRTASSDGQRLQAPFDGRRGGTGHGLVRGRDRDRSTPFSSGPRPELRGLRPGVPEGERCRASLRDSGACDRLLAARGTRRGGGACVGRDASAHGRATRRECLPFKVRGGRGTPPGTDRIADAGPHARNLALG